MSSIDLRTVKMSFDNAEFERRVGTTLGTLDKLKQSLNFTGATKGMEEINAAANRISFDHLVEGVDFLQNRFSVFGEFVHNIFMDIVNTAANAGRQIANALVFDPIKDGFSEYETQINAIQTILANTESKGTTLDDVNRALDELNTYADKTIYNFTEMTRNIGTFTAAGVDLDTSVNAIQGIANLAAISGSSSEQASRAMYQLSQALSSGVVHLQDWNSVVNAGMGGEVFQNAIMETARVHGIAIDEMMESAGSFRAMLNAQDYGDWLNDEIFLESLEKFRAGSEGITEQQLKDMQDLYRARGYTEEQIKSLTAAQNVLTDAEWDELKAVWKAKGYNDEQVEEIFRIGKSATAAATEVKTFTQLLDTLKEGLGSGWTQSWEYIVGDFEQAKALWTEIHQVLSIYIDASARARNAVLKDWRDNGGRTAVIDSIRNAFQALLGVLIPVKQAFDEIFPPITAEQLIENSNKLKDFTASLKITDEEGKKVKATAERLFGYLRRVFDGIINSGKTAYAIITTVGKAIGDAFGTSYMARIGSFTDRFKKFTESIMPSEKALESLGKLVKGLASVFRAFLYIAIRVGLALFDGLGKAFTDLKPQGESFIDLIGKIGDWLSRLADNLQKTFNFEVISSGFGSIIEAALNLYNAFADFINLDGIIEWWKNFFDVTKGAAPSLDILKFFANVFTTLTTAIADFTSKIDLSKLDIGKLMNLAANSVLFKKTYDILSAILDKLKDGAPETTNSLLKLKDGIIEIFKAIKDNLITLRNVIVDVAQSIQTAIKVRIFQRIARSFALLVAALYVLSIINTEDLAKATAAITVLMVEVAALMNYLATIEFVDHKALSKVAGSMIGIAAAIYILASALKKIGSMDPQQISAGLLAVTLLLAEMLYVAKEFSKMEMDLAKGAGTLIGFSAAIYILASAVKAIGKLKPEEAAVGVGAIVVLVQTLVRAFKKLGEKSMDPAQISSVASAILIFSVSMKILASIVKTFANLEFDKLAQGVIGLGVIMAMVVYVANNLPADFVSPEQLTKVATALVIFAASVKILASVVKDFAEIPWQQLLVGLGGLVVVMASLVIVASKLSSEKVNPEKITAVAISLLIFVGSVKMLSDIVVQLSSIPWQQLIIGIGGLAAIMITLGAAAFVFSSDKLDPVKITAVGNALLAFSFSIGIVALSLQVLSSIPWPALLISLGALVLYFAIIGGAAAILGPLVPVITGLAGAVALLGAGVLAFGLGIGIAAAGLAFFVATFAAAGLSLAEIGRQLLDLFKNIGIALANMFISFWTTIGQQAPLLAEAFSQVLFTLLATLQVSLPMITETLWMFLASMIEQFATYVPQIAEAALQFINAFLIAIANNLPSILDSAITIVLTFVDGIAQRLPDIINSAFNLLICFINGLADAIEANHAALFEAVGHLIIAICDAILDGAIQVVRTGGDLLQHLIDGMFDFYQEFFNVGVNLIAGFIDGLWSMAGNIWDAACDLAMTAWNAITGTLDEHSPSRLAFGGGVNFIQGFIDGMLDRESATISEAGALAYAALTAFQSGLDSVDYNPTITPVIDSNEIQNGISSINNMLYQLPETYGITTNIANDKAMKKQLVEIMGSSNDYTDIIGSINNLRSDLQIYNDQLSKMQIVMDSGTLVGELTPGFDRSLGMRQMMVGRGAI